MVYSTLRIFEAGQDILRTTFARNVKLAFSRNANVLTQALVGVMKSDLEVPLIDVKLWDRQELVLQSHRCFLEVVRAARS